MTSLYLCCQPDDRDRHSNLFRALKSLQYEVLLPPDGLPGSGDWLRAMKQAVQDCDQVLLILNDDDRQPPDLEATLAYARRLNRRLAYYAGDAPRAREYLLTLGLERGDITRVDPDDTDSQGIRGLLRSRGHTLSRSPGNTPGDNQKTLWMRHVTEELVQRMPGRTFNQTEFLRVANRHLRPDNQYDPRQISNLFAYHRGLIFSIVHLIAYIRVFQRWIPDYTRADALAFLRLSGVDENDLQSDWMARKLNTLFAARARINLAFPDAAPSFYGRETELDDLYESLALRDTRIVLLQGMPGIGKTELAKRAAEKCMGNFDVIFWVEMRTPISVDAFVRQFVNFVAPDPQREPDQAQFIERLNTFRCLIIFDQFEAVLDRGDNYESYLPDYAAYDGLLRAIAATRHNSTLLLTSTHPPPGFTVDFPARYYGRVERYPVQGLDWEYACSLPETRDINPTDDDLKRLVAHFNGHPSAIKSAILKIHDGQYPSIPAYLADAPREGEHVEAGVNELARGAPLSLDALYWLAVERDYLSLDRLCALMRESRTRLNKAVKRLAAAYLIEPHPQDYAAYRIRSDALDYVTERLLQRFMVAVEAGDIAPLMSHGLKLAGSLDYLREAQENILLKPLLNALVEKMGREPAIWRLRELVKALQQPQWRGRRGYAAANILHLLHGLNAPTDDLDFSGAAFYEADLRHVSLHRIDARAAEFKDCLFAENFSNCLCMSLDPSGQTIAVGTTEGRVHVWDVSSGAERWATPHSQIWMFAITITADGRWVIGGDYHGIIHVWDINDGQLVSQYEAQTGKLRLHHVAVGGDNFLASVGDDGLVRLWRVDEGSLNLLWTHGPYPSPRPGYDRLYAVAFHPDGNILAVGGEQQQICLLRYDTARPEIIGFLEGHVHTVWALAFSPDGRYLASASEDYTVRLWDVADLSDASCRTILRGHANTPFSLDFSLDSRMLASGGIDKTIHLWDVETGKLIKPLNGHRRWIRAVCFRPGQPGELVSCGDDKAIRFWDVERGETIRSHQGVQLWARALAFSPDRSTIAISRESLIVGIRDTSTWSIQGSIKFAFNSWVRALAFSPREPVLAAAHENWIILFDVTTGEYRRSIMAYNDQEFIWSLEYTPDGAYLICAGGDEPKTVSFWDTTTWQRYDILNPHRRWVWKACPSPDGARVATSGDDRSIRLWSVHNRELLDEVTDAHQHSIWMLAFTPDGRFLVSATNEPTDPAIVWDVSGERIRPHARIYTSHARKVTAIAISAGGLLVTGGEEGDLELWELYEIEPRRCAAFRAHDATIHALAFLPGTGVVASASSGHIVKVWDTEAGEQVAALEYPRLYEGFNLAGASGLSGAQLAALQSFGARLDE